MIIIHLEEINEKVLAEERRLKRYLNNVKKYKQNWNFQIKEREFYTQFDGKKQKQMKNRMQKKKKTVLDQVMRADRIWLKCQMDKKKKGTYKDLKKVPSQKYTELPQKYFQEKNQLGNFKLWWDSGFYAFTPTLDRFTQQMKEARIIE